MFHYKSYQTGGLPCPAGAELQGLNSNDDVRKSKGEKQYIEHSLGSGRFMIHDHCCYIKITRKEDFLSQVLAFDLGILVKCHFMWHYFHMNTLWPNYWAYWPVPG